MLPPLFLFEGNMKVTIINKISGSIRTLNKRDADILVKLKRAEYYDASASQGTYQTKVMIAAPVGSIPVLQDLKTPLEIGAKNDDNTVDSKSEIKQAKKKNKSKVSAKEE